MEFQISLGGIDFCVHCKSETIKNHYSEFIEKVKEPKYHISVEPEDLLREWQESSWYDGNDASIDRIAFEPIFERQVITRKIVDKLLVSSAMVMHGAVICDGRYAFMITAPSGTGKSTRARLFLEKHPEGFVLNGDKPIIRVEENRVMAYGSPWKGKEGWGINAEYPLKAIFLLERAESTTIEQTTLSDAFDFLLHQVHIPSGTLGALEIIRLLKSLEGKVRFFRFFSPATTEAMEAAYQALREN